MSYVCIIGKSRKGLTVTKKLNVLFFNIVAKEMLEIFLRSRCEFLLLFYWSNYFAKHVTFSNSCIDRKYTYVCGLANWSFFKVALLGKIFKLIVIRNCVKFRWNVPSLLSRSIHCLFFHFLYCSKFSSLLTLIDVCKLQQLIATYNLRLRQTWK